jgi:hypothetical protein
VEEFETLVVVGKGLGNVETEGMAIEEEIARRKAMEPKAGIIVLIKAN